MPDTQFNWNYTGVLVKKATKEYTQSLGKIKKLWWAYRSYHLPIQSFCIFAWILLSAPAVY